MNALAMDTTPQRQSQLNSPSPPQQSSTASPKRTFTDLCVSFSQNPGQYVYYPHLHETRFIEPLHEHCAFKAVQGAVVGGAMGALFTLAMNVINVGMGTSLHQPGYVEAGQKLSWSQMRADMRSWGKTTFQSMRSSAKAFALFSSVYAASDCLLEKSRGKHDYANAVAAGGIAGAVCALRAGPGAMMFGAIGGAAFTYVIEHFMTS